MGNMAGNGGELIAVLMDIVDDDPEEHPYWWVDVSGALADTIGGCNDIVPETGRTGADGVLAWEHRSDREVVYRGTWMRRLRERLTDLVAEGMAEDFLVVGAREHVHRLLRAVDGASPAAARSKYDEWIAEQAVSGDNLELSLIARALLGPTPDVDLADRPAGLATRWRAVTADSLSDEVVDAWRAAGAADVSSPLTSRSHTG